MRELSSLMSAFCFLSFYIMLATIGVNVSENTFNLVFECIGLLLFLFIVIGFWALGSSDEHTKRD